MAINTLRRGVLLVLAGSFLSAQAQRPAGQSPAAQLRPQTATKQEYPAEQVQLGERRFSGQCGFCHGRDAAGGETGPDLTRSALVAEDVRGDKIAPVLRQGRKEQGMPAFELNDADLAAIVAFIHDQKSKFDALGGGRRSVEPTDLATGDAEAGRRYFNGAGGCYGCHSPTGDLKSIATRYKGLELLQRMLYPNARPLPTPPKVGLTLPSGQTLAAPLLAQDEFSITILDASGERKKYQKTDVKFNIVDPIQAHFAQLGKYSDKEMHDVFAYMDTLK